ncbi:hypothetical protein [Kitasatospora cathayae]|uniref:RAMA domain-containing protein n=1 Tax=Kitasatospora cathayae TaxID=3004092 RepID=A0ABY7Q2V0_9ACTN|nr:hypothetical protein [Kitasatospora sp. HUAS 3-15]WBP87018.1 hypothetical protein O1G21_14990 [Kitasatospora sp. HUAS 3-15]
MKVRVVLTVDVDPEQPAEAVSQAAAAASCPTHPQASGRAGDEKYHTDGRCQRHTEMSTDQLRKGDVVITHGMRVLLEEEPRVYPKGDRTVYAFDGRVANLEEVKAHGHVPLDYLRTHKWVDGQGWVTDREDMWQIQGNELARWTVER